jgi:hypothetical protein
MTTDQDHYLVLGVDPSASARAGRGRGKPGRAELPPGGVEHRRGMGVLVGIHATYDIDRLMLLCIVGTAVLHASIDRAARTSRATDKTVKGPLARLL